MADAKYRFCLTDDEKRELNQMVSSGKRNARQVLDALILLNCDESEGKKQSDEIIGGFLKVGKLRVHREFVSASLKTECPACSICRMAEDVPSKQTVILKRI